MYLRLIGFFFKSLWHFLKQDRYMVKLKLSTTEDTGYAADVRFQDDTHLSFQIVMWDREAMEMNYALAVYLKAAIINNAIGDKSAHITNVIVEKVG